MATPPNNSKDQQVPPIVVEQLTLHAVALFTESARALGLLSAFSPEQAAIVRNGAIEMLLKQKGN